MKVKYVWKPVKDQVYEAASVGSVSVRIYRRERRKPDGKIREVYSVADYTAGRRRLQTFADLGDARRTAEQIARSLSTGEVTAANINNRDAASLGRALELIRPTGASLEVACATYAKIFEICGDAGIEAAKLYSRSGADRLTRKTVADVVTELVTTKEAQKKSTRYVNDLKNRLDRFVQKHAVDISTVTTADVQRFLDGLKKAPQTTKNFRTVLHTLFKFAETRGYIFKGGNPVADTERVSANGDGAIEIFSPAEMLALLSNAPGDFIPVLALGAFAGLRASEIQKLEWADVDLPGKFIHVSADKSKTRSRRLVPVLRNLAAWLSSYGKKKGLIWKGSPDDFRKARSETVEKAETPWKDNALRHSFISYRLADVQNAAQVALEAGNSPGMVFKHYRELVRPDAAKAWFAIAPEAPANVLAMIKETQ